MKILFNYIKQHKKHLSLALVLAAINQCFSLCDSIITGKLINHFGNAKETYLNNFELFFKEIIFWLGLSVGAAMVSRLAKNFQDYNTNIIIQRTGAAMYTDGIKKVLSLPYKEFEDQRSGETLGKLQKVKTDTEKFVTLSISLIFQSIIGIIFVFVYALKINMLIGPLFLATVPVIGFVSSFLGKKIKSISKQILGETTALAGATTESLRNIELVKSLGLINQEEKRLNDTTFKILGLELKKVRYIRSLSFIQGTTVHFVRTILVFALYYFVFKGMIQVGDLITLMFFSFFIFNPLQELGNVITTYNETKISMDNFSKLISTDSEVVPVHPDSLGQINSIQFNNVSFAHNSKTTYAVKDVNLSIAKGKTIAFVGPSGSGKTTIVKLLLGLYQPQQGQVLYNEINSNNINLNDLRMQLGLVSQDAQLFSGTIKDNLKFVKPDASENDVMAALEKASCNTILSRTKEGINSTIGEGGIKLSGGEKQRLAIARALLRQPKLLIFDEATSALDSITEEEISETIRSISKDKEQIIILIAHRLSTVMHADEIYVLEHGSIVEKGKHEELLDKKGLYYAMWRQQIGERKG